MPLEFHGVDLTHPANRVPSGRVTIAQNIRSYSVGSINFRNLLTTALFTLSDAIHSIRRLNDSTPNGPSDGYTLINGAGTNMYSGSTVVATGLTGNPVSEIPFRPNTSVQPWMYVGDSAIQGAVTLETEYLITNTLGGHTAVDFPSNGLMKIRSDGVCYKTGIKEPQLAPSVSTENSSVTTTGVLYATAIPWTNYPTGTNADFDYGETEGYPNTTAPVDGTAPYTINVENATTITITIPDPTDTVIINGSVVTTPTATGPTLAPTNPGYYVQPAGGVSPPTTTPSVIIGAFTDGDGLRQPWIFKSASTRQGTRSAIILALLASR
jgi:hypothetical protein